MKYFLLFTIIFFHSSRCLRSQSLNYADSILHHREDYKKAFLEEENSPLNKKELRDLAFFPPDADYRLTATFTRIPDSTGFDMHTHSGKIKPYVVYGKLDFYLQNKPYTLFIYQSVTLREKKGFEDYLFVPFQDLTNGESTYGGGRYLDFTMKDIVANQVILDFNKAYNPYCAYKGGYSCPIPPKENSLNINIKAGEMRYKKEPKD